MVYLIFLGKIDSMNDDRQSVSDSEFFGGLKAREYGRLLKDAREARISRLEIHDEAARSGGKTANLLSVHGIYWWYFYELSLPEHMALFFCLLGWGTALSELSRQEKPLSAFLDFMHDREESDRNPVAEMESEQQALLVNVLFGALYSLEALGYYSLSINELLARARDGDVACFQRAVSVDRAVIATETGGQLIGNAQLRRDKAFLSGLFRRIKSPHSGRRQYVDLRLMHCVFVEASALEGVSQDRVLQLIEHLELYTGRRNDPVKGLSELFRNWRKEATI